VSVVVNVVAQIDSVVIDGANTAADTLVSGPMLAAGPGVCQVH